MDHRYFNKTCLTCDPSPYHRHPSSPGGQPWVAPVPPWHLPPRAWPNSVDPNGVLLSQTGTPGLNISTGLSRLSPLTGPGQHAAHNLPWLEVPVKDHAVGHSQGRPIPANVVARISRTGGSRSTTTLIKSYEWFITVLEHLINTMNYYTAGE